MITAPRSSRSAWLLVNGTASWSRNSRYRLRLFDNHRPCFTNRGVEDAEPTCRTVAVALTDLPDEAVADTPEAVFQRLGGGA